MSKEDFEKIHNRLNSIDITLAKQSVLLEEHMRRSLANEEALEIIKEELKPVFTNLTIVHFIGKLIMLVIGSGILVELIKWILAK